MIDKLGLPTEKIEPYHVRIWLNEYNLYRLEHSKCEHDWKYDEFTQYGEPMSKYCEKCDIRIEIE